VIVDLRPTDPDSLPDTPLPEPKSPVAASEESGQNLGGLPFEETRESHHPGEETKKENKHSRVETVADVMSKISS
ncbi:hypothetical protein FOZ62_007120, partial [Perkinsus olseni]